MPVFLSCQNHSFNQLFKKKTENIVFCKFSESIFTLMSYCIGLTY
jgi:hypothetical protein